jgi:hypothetical protein
MIPSTRYLHGLWLCLIDGGIQAWCCDKCPGEPDRWAYVGTTKNSRLYLRVGQGYQRYEKYAVFVLRATVAKHWRRQYKFEVYDREVLQRFGKDGKYVIRMKIVASLC